MGTGQMLVEEMRVGIRQAAQLMSGPGEQVGKRGLFTVTLRSIQLY